MQKNELLDLVEQHPRLLGFLFTTGIVLSQAGTVVANAGANNGP